MDEVGNIKFLSEGETKLQTTTTTTNPTIAFFLTLYVFETKLCRCKPHLLVVLATQPFCIQRVVNIQEAQAQHCPQKAMLAYKLRRSKEDLVQTANFISSIRLDV